QWNIAFLGFSRTAKTRQEQEGGMCMSDYCLEKDRFLQMAALFAKTQQIKIPIGKLIYWSGVTERGAEKNTTTPGPWVLSDRVGPSRIATWPISHTEPMRFPKDEDGSMPHKTTELGPGWLSRQQMANLFDVNQDVFDKNYRRYAPDNAVKRVGQRVYFH